MKKRQQRNIPRAKVTMEKAKPDPTEIEKELAQRLCINRLGQKLNGADAYSNPLAFLGEASPIFSAGTFIKTNLTKNFCLLTAAYRTSSLVSRIIDTPAEDMTRAWYALTADFDPEDMAELRKLEARHSVKQELTDAIRWARLYGGSLALMIIRGENEKLDQPLDLDALPPDCFQGLLVLDRATGVTPSTELVCNLDDPDYGLPEYYTVDMNSENAATLKIHHSRVLRFVSRELPRMEMIEEEYWGASELEHMWASVLQYETITASISELTNKASISTMKLGNLGELYSLGTEETKARIDAVIAEMGYLMTSHGTLLLGPEDSMERQAYSFDGLKDIHEVAMLNVSGAAEIPVTKLFGRSPAGMNATGESDMRNYCEMISGLQERMLRPALERLLPVMVISCWGYLPEDLGFVFNPLTTMTPEQVGDIAMKFSATVEDTYEAGLITRNEARAELRALGEKYAIWTKLSDEEGGDRDPSTSSG